MALEFMPEALRIPEGHFIGGHLHSDKNEISLSVNLPSTGQPFASITDGGAERVYQAVSVSLRAFQLSGWASCAPRERARKMYRWADLIEQDTLLLHLEVACSTRPVNEVRSGDRISAAETIRFFAELADKSGGDVAATRNESLGFVAAEPYGVIGAITPWNFPLSMAAWKCGPALAAGNAVVIKPSEFTPFSTVRLAELTIAAGIPAGILNVVHGRGDTTGAALVSHPDISKMSFTGSPATGASVMAGAASSGTKPVTLELGGKRPQLVFSDVNDLKSVADNVFRGFTSNAGQVCSRKPPYCA